MAKFNAVLVGLGALLIMLAGGLGVNLLLSGSADDEITTTPTHTPRPSAVPTGRPTTVVPGPTTPTSLVPVSVSTPPKSSPAAPKPSASPSPTPTWTMVWSDAFSSAALGSAWTATVDEKTDLDASCHIAANVAVTNGMLVLSGAKPTDPYTCGAATTAYTGAHVYTNATWPTDATWTGGAAEIRAHTTGGLSSGLWPGIWLTDLDVAIFGPDGITYGTPGGSGTTAVTTSDWHTYRVEWDATGVRWFMSDANETVWTQLWSTTGAICASGCRLHVDYNLGGSATPGDPPYPQLEVDYVRVYKK